MAPENGLELGYIQPSPGCVIVWYPLKELFGKIKSSEGMQKAVFMKEEWPKISNQARPEYVSAIMISCWSKHSI